MIILRLDTLVFENTKGAVLNSISSGSTLNSLPYKRCFSFLRHLSASKYSSRCESILPCENISYRYSRASLFKNSIVESN